MVFAIEPMTDASAYANVKTQAHQYFPHFDTNALDTLIQRIYEDNVEGKISDDRFAKLSSNYETEQAQL
jgi:sensor histidine kinase YesM